MGPTERIDRLIAGLRERASDPHRRSDAPESAFSASVSSMSLGDLFGASRSALSDLMRVVDANRAGRIEPDLIAKAASIERSMSTVAEPDARPVATDRHLAVVEAELGARLPEALRRAYREVADGGFGPGGGLFSLGRALETYGDLRAEPVGPRGQAWPAGLLPLVDGAPGYTCVDVATGQIIDWDPEELTEWSSVQAWRATFSLTAPTVEEWLETWLASPPFWEVVQEELERSMVESAREARATIGAMTPQERAAMGLPEVGWEKVVWGGIGLEDPAGS